MLGGRNIGDEYFGLGEVDFQDIDVLGGGPIAGASTASFEAYWNSPFAIPMASLGRYEITGPALDADRAALRESIDQIRDSPYARALRDSNLARALRAQDLQLEWTEAKLLSDPPDKITAPPGTLDDSHLGGQLSPLVEAVQSDLLVMSPYFVPGKRGVQFFGGKSQRGVSVRILTNSLAATDVWLVHAGYRKYRRPLLKAGVKLYELKPVARGAAGIKGLVGSSRASLHGKTFVFDRRSVFIGSVNIDPRSLYQNTEVGVLLSSPRLAAEVAALFERWAGPGLAYEVKVAQPGHALVWIGADDGRPVQVSTEPQAGFWRRLGAAVCSYLPIESLI